MRFLISLFFIASILIIPSRVRADAEADSFCDDLKYVLADALNEFRHRRGDYNFYVSEYIGLRNIGAFKRCETSSDQGVSEYKCEISDLPDDLTNARMLLNVYVEKVKACLGTSIKKSYKAIVDNARIRVMPDDESIEISALRIDSPTNKFPPFFVLDLDVSYVDPSAP